MYYSQFVGAEEVQHNIDIHCGEETDAKLSSDLFNYKLQYLSGINILVLVHILGRMFLCCWWCILLFYFV